MTLKEELESEERRHKAIIIEAATALVKLEEIKPFLSLDTVEDVWAWISPHQIQINFSSGSPEKRQASVHALVQAIGGKLEKSVGDDCIEMEGSFRGMKVRINGYLPPTCRLVEEEVVVPAVPEHTRKVRRVVCDEELV